jgi:hypothetical protein
MSDQLLEQLLGQPSIVSNGRGGWLCSVCSGYVRADATSCKHCHVTFGVASSPGGQAVGAPARPVPARAPQAKSRTPLVIAGVVIGILALSCVLVLLFGGGMGNTRRVAIGQQGRLVGGDEKGVMVVTTERARDALNSKTGTEKVFEIINLQLGGEIMTVPNDTPVLVLDADEKKMKIRILAGIYTDKIGWVPVYNVKP